MHFRLPNAARAVRPSGAAILRESATALLAFLALSGAVAGAEPSLRVGDGANESNEPNSQGSEIPPYIVALDRTHATIAWRTRAPLRGQLTLRSYSNERTLQESDAPSRSHRIRIDGLDPGTRYRYEIGGSHRGHFTTAGEDDSLDVVVFGHSAGTTQPGEYPTALLAQTLVGIDPDFAIATGDITYHASVRDFSLRFFGPFEAFLARKPIYVCPANHESAWPWLHGVGFDVFRRLFPYDYAGPLSAPTQDAYYSAVYKHVKLVSLPFTRDSNTMLRQLAWAEAELDASQSEFNLVVVGGGYTKESGGDLLFERLSRHRVDLVLAGDGSGAYQANYHGVPFFFAGDGGLDHHPFYYLEFERYRFSVKLLTSGGEYLQFFPEFYSKRKKRAVQDLATSARRLKSSALLFPNVGRRSTDYDGLQLVVPFDGPKGSLLEVCWSPASSGSAEEATGGCESMLGYREKWLLLEPGRPNRFTIALPRLDPLTGEPYELGAIRLRVLDGERHEPLATPEIGQAKLFRDARHTREARDPAKGRATASPPDARAR
jgi:hypothetical protein